MPGSKTVCRNIILWEKASGKAAYAEMDAHIKRSQEYAQTRRRWVDRNDQARSGLTGSTDTSGTKITSTLAHTADHGVYLETRMAFLGRFKILEEAILSGLPTLYKRLQGIFGGRGFGLHVSGVQMNKVGKGD